MRFAPLAASIALSLPSAAFAQGVPAKPTMAPNVPEYNLSTDVFDFPSGLRIMMQRDPSHPVVGVFTIVNHGTADDPAGKEETAHFVEHTWFRSAQLNFPSIMNFVFDYGTMFNATTRNDWTDFRTVARKEYLPTLLKLESLRLTDPYKGVTEAMIDTEREVIRNEWRRRNEQDQALFVDYLYESIYPAGHGYHDHSTHDSINNIKLADLQKYMDDYYHPDETTILVVGDFEQAEALDLIFDNFDPAVLDSRLKPEHFFEYPRPGVSNPDKNNPAHWLTGAWDPASDPNDPNRAAYPFADPTERAPRITQERPPVPELGSKEVLTRQGPFDHKMVAVGWSLPGGYRDDQWNLMMVANTAGQYVGSGPMFQDWTDPDHKQVGDVFCFAMPEVLNTSVLCVAEVLDDKLDPLIVRDKMVDNLASIWNPENFMGNTISGQIYNQSFARAKNEILSDTLLNLDLFAREFGGRSETLVPYAHLNNSLTAVSDAMKQAMGMDPNQISKLAYEYLKRDRFATVILEPLPEDEIDVGSEKSSYSGSNVTDAALAFSDDLSKFSTPESIVAEYTEPDLSALQDYTLPNGVRVLLLPHGNAPVVDVKLVLGRNGDSEPKGLLDFATRFTSSVGNDPLPIAGQVSWFVNPGIPGLAPPSGNPLMSMDPGNIRRGAIVLNGRAPAGNLDGVLWLMRDEMASAKPSMDGLPSYLDDKRDGVKANWSKADWHLNKATTDYLYPSATNRQAMTWEDVDVVAGWGAAEVTAYLNRTFQPSNATLIIAGNVDAEAAKKAVQTYFGGWAAAKGAEAPAPKVEPPALPTEPAKILIFNDPKRTQSDVTMYCRLNLKGAPGEDIAVDVASSLMQYRVFNEIRVNRGLAYSPGASASIDDGGAGRATFYSDGVVNAGVGQILQYYKQVVAEVHDGTIDPNQVLISKVRHARRDGLDWQSTDQVTTNLADLVIAGKDLDTVSSRGEDLAGITVQQLADLMADCGEHTITTIEGPKDIVIPQLDELGYTYEVVEWSALGDELLWKYDPKAAKKKEKDRLKQEKKDAKKADKPAADDGQAEG